MTMALVFDLWRAELHGFRYHGVLGLRHMFVDVGASGVGPRYAWDAGVTRVFQWVLW